MSRFINVCDSAGESIIIRCFMNFPAIDALALPRSHERFRHLAQHTFRLYPESVEIILTNEINGNKLGPLECELAKVDGLVRVNAIMFNGSNNAIGKNEFLRFIDDHFRLWELKRLKFENTRFDLEDADKFGQIFNNLIEKIEFRKCEEIDDGAYEAIVLQCIQLKELIMIDVKYFSFMYIREATEKVESLHLHNVYFWGGKDLCALTIGNQMKSLILQHVPVIIKCPSKDLSRLHTLKLCSIECNMPCKLLSYTGDQLKHLHLANINSNGSQLCRLGNQLETLSLFKCPNFRSTYIHKLLQNNQNLRSIKMCYVGDESMFREVPRRASNVEELCIWPAREEEDAPPLNFDRIQALSKLKSFTFLSPKYSREPDVLVDLIEQLTRIDTLECVGLLIRLSRADQMGFADKIFEFKNLKTLNLVVWGPNPLKKREISAEVRKHFPDLENLKIMIYVEEEEKFDNFYGKYCCDMPGRKNAGPGEEAIVNGDQPNDAKEAPSSQLDVHKHDSQALSMDSDALFDFFNDNAK